MLGKYIIVSYTTYQQNLKKQLAHSDQIFD